MTTKTLKIILGILSFLFLLLNIVYNLIWLFYVTASLWTAIGGVAFFEEKKKREKGIFFRNDVTLTLISYTGIVGSFTFQYFNTALHDNFSDDIAQGAMYLGLIAWIVLSRALDSYFLIDNTGIRTRHKSLDFVNIKAIRETEKALLIDELNGKTKMVLRKKLLTEEMVEFIRKKTRTGDQ